MREISKHRNSEGVVSQRRTVQATQVVLPRCCTLPELSHGIFPATIRNTWADLKPKVFAMVLDLDIMPGWQSRAELCSDLVSRGRGE